MSLGLGIVLSAILLLVVWQIDKHSAWRKARRVALWLLVGLIVIGAVGYTWTVWWPEVKAKRELAAQVAQVRNPINLPYWGITLGMTKAEVNYLKGTATETSFIEPDRKKHEVWDYKFGPAPFEYTYEVWWNSEGTGVRGISCSGSSGGYASYYCEKLAGVGIESTEAAVRATLGEPLAEALPCDNGTKLLRYGNETDQVRFELSRGAVIGIIRARHEVTGEEAPPNASFAPQTPSGVTRYTVTRGDTMNGIAKRFSTTPELLRQLNALPTCEILVVGTVLIVPSPTQ